DYFCAIGHSSGPYIF
nr:immunoglobulin light chain junction region [Macaca mulatta]MOV65832.1 immunoglobulin light chain junction region [Macaca mulatta]MOV65846.1 immunoglobulin light chain junction region [Macaca mulatta]MOV65866.1 immunoglobulin light chain junction region [Macaca mulatta]MOV66123.1 immunoglobulin light chain junction region [Macaca mulatta]